MNLDRFSRPLYHERAGLDLAEIDRQNELNKRDLVDTFISEYWSEYQTLPDAEFIQETFYKVDLDMDLIQEQIRRF